MAIIGGHSRIKDLGTFDSLAARPPNLTSADTGRYAQFTRTGNRHEWSGTEWLVRDTNNTLNVLDYGAIGGAGVVDDHAAIQLAINIARYHAAISPIHAGKRGFGVFIPPGLYRISKTLQLGYGIPNTGYSSISLRGSHRDYRGDVNSGSILLADFSDSPAIAVQGSRLGQITDLCIRGANAAHGVPLDGTIDVSIPASWASSGLAANVLSRYAPYAGIAIDPYSGVRPAISYPDVSYPTYVGGVIVPQYGKDFSSAVTIDRCFIYGFTVGVAIQPSDSDANGDFVAMDRVSIDRCVYSISVGNSQSRLVNLSRCILTSMHTAFVTGLHGRRIGRIGGSISNTCIESCYQWIDVGSTGFSGPLTFANCYGENVGRIGDWSAVSYRASPLVLSNCEIGFFELGGVPASHLRGENVTISGGTLKNRSLISIASNNSSAIFRNNCYIQNLKSSILTAYEKLALSACDGVALPSMGREIAISSEISYRANYTTPLPSSNYRIYQRESGTLDRRSRFSLWYLPTGVDKATPNVISTLVGSTLTITWGGAPNLTNPVALTAGLIPGGVILDSATNSVFFIRSRSGNVVIAELQNNTKILSGLTTFAPGFTLNTGVYWVANTSVFTPDNFLKADSTAGSAVLTNCGGDQGNFSLGTNRPEVGDWIIVQQDIDNFVSASAVEIVAIDVAGRTITMALPASKTTVGRHLRLFIKAPLPNA
jgi:Pectate lyase superfamily protein